LLIVTDQGGIKAMKLSLRKSSMTLTSVLFLIVIFGGLMTSSFAEEDIIYGRQLMTPEEIAQHRAKMRSFQTEQERATYRLEHHRKMQQRAEIQGFTLPETPMERGSGMGVGRQRSDGMGHGRP
jgi:hypothetical protein